MKADHIHIIFNKSEVSEIIDIKRMRQRREYSVIPEKALLLFWGDI